MLLGDKKIFKNSKTLVGILAILTLLILITWLSNSFTTTNNLFDLSTEIENVKIKEMGIEKLRVEDGTSVLTTTGGIFHIDLKAGVIEIRQRIGKNRPLAKVILLDDQFEELSTLTQMGFDVVWKGNSSNGPKIIISGDSVIRFFNIERLEVLLYFTPVHQILNVSVSKCDNGGLLALDNDGGLAIIPPGCDSTERWPTERWPTEFKNNVWKLVAEEPLPLLFIGVLPPRPFDWERSFMPVIHYSSHIQRYPTDKQIATYSKYAKVLEMHSWVWQNRYNENDRDEKGEKLPLWADYSYLPQNDKWIPDNEIEFKRVVNTAHAYSMKVLSYVSVTDKADFGLQIAEIKRLKDVYGIDGVYLDGLFPQHPELSYKAARALREIFGEDGWLTLHDTHGSGYWAPFINSYMDLLVTSEHNTFERWTSTSYKISNAIASLWPEIPLDVEDGREFLKKLVDDSLLYNNRVILMAGEQGQWRDWRLYFTPDETEFMKEYYLKALEKMKEVGHENFILELKIVRPIKLSILNNNNENSDYHTLLASN